MPAKATQPPLVWCVGLYLLYSVRLKMNTDIAERIRKGNKAYYTNAKLIKSKFLTKKRPK
jgi:hypothetical protein